MRTTTWTGWVALALSAACSPGADSALAPASASPSLAPASGVTEVSVLPLLIARGLNDKGVVVGQLLPSPNARGGVRYPSGRVVTLGVLPGDSWSDADAVNNRGQVVGRSGNGSRTQAFIWDPDNGMRSLGSLAGGSEFPSDIDDQGTVVGTSWLLPTAPSPQTAFVWKATSGMQDLGAVIGDQIQSAAVDLSNSGTILGSARRGTFVYAPGETRYLPPSLGTYPTGLSVTGAVVGQAWDPATSKSRAFRWSARTGYVFISPADADHGIAWAVSDRGTIVGQLVYNNFSTPRAFILAPDRALYVGGPWTSALAVNACGVAAGFSSATGSSGAMWVPAGVPFTGACSP
jgi:probable HAF family extracellular repeat protein